MASSAARRPLPALIALLALLLFTAIVWWRVIARSSTAPAGAACPTPTASTATTAPPSPAGSPTAALPAPAGITLRVLNSTHRGGLAARVRSGLLDAGFRIPTAAANDESGAKNPGVAQIRYSPGAAQAAKTVQYYLPGSKLVAHGASGSTVVVALGQKFSSIASPAQARAAMASARVATTPSATRSATAAPSSPASPSC